MHSITTPRIKKGRSADPRDRSELARLVEELGDHDVAIGIGCSVNTVCRFLAGLDCYPMTHAAVAAYLNRSRDAA